MTLRTLLLIILLKKRKQEDAMNHGTCNIELHGLIGYIMSQLQNDDDQKSTCRFHKPSINSTSIIIHYILICFAVKQYKWILFHLFFIWIIFIHKMTLIGQQTSFHHYILFFLYWGGGVGGGGGRLIVWYDILGTHTNCFSRINVVSMIIIQWNINDFEI